MGYIHSVDTHQHAFLHKSSVPQFYISYNNSKLPATTLPNHYTYLVKSNVIHDFEDQACAMSPSDATVSRHCYIDHLESKLNCSLHWNQNQEISEVCQQCQFPFKFNGQEYNDCTLVGLDQEANRSWCATGVRPDRSLFDASSWLFCPSSNSCRSTVNESPTQLRSCKTRKDLENLVSVAFDRLQDNPSEIANALKEIGCPFSCQYIQHSVKSVLKRHDPRIGADKVRLHFQMDDIIEEGQNIMESDVNVTLDMFISDIGTAFGLLLGIKL